MPGKNRDPKTYTLTGERFQSTPRFVSGANGRGGLVGRKGSVSIHTPLRQRGEPGAPGVRPDPYWFQSTPRFVSGANGRGGLVGRKGCVSIHTPLRQRGEPGA